MVALTVTKKRILAVLCFILAAVLAVCACIQGARAIQAASTKRSLPIYNVQTDEKKIAISFDAAWGNEQTQTLIDILKQYNVHATFFVVGAWVDKYPDSVKALAEAGHEVCNHSNTHPHMPKLTQQEMTAQITECNKKIMAITGKSPLLFRPPYGDYNNAVIDTVNSLKMYPIQWDVETQNTKIM
ncbi:polysaccharide deacetylase family protein [Thermocaproicibacter melissae]|jgi:peptidoglycan-N-acetylglucosamine deacetylase|uniref:polysaccharide deacetylase family protein n=1 Tax=Thermocaproicibacter melissae TaxID=2966552 RepID=UPI0024B0D6B9|nr:polysaccharide deacetylase family protein [Thermocaproicibacter melissae]WBY63700.1 polysaccharide deacetylase family protein [Thermocaproicibacter melissae]